MVKPAIDRSGVHDHLVRSRRLAQQLPAPNPNVTAKHRVPVRHPDKVVLAVPDRMAATFVRFHPANLHRKRRDPIRLKAWGFPIPYRGL